MDRTFWGGKKGLIFHICVPCFIVLYVVAILKLSVTCELECECTGGMCRGEILCMSFQYKPYPGKDHCAHWIEI
jgi:hypothetical protein